LSPIAAAGAGLVAVVLEEIAQRASGGGLESVVEHGGRGDPIEAEVAKLLAQLTPATHGSAALAGSVPYGFGAGTVQRGGTG
jgi:hypothetical protein